MKKQVTKAKNSDSDSGNDEVIHLDSLEFVDLGELYSPGSLHALVAKIETEGVWSYDRFGQLKNHAPSSEQALKALDALEEQYKKEKDGFEFGEDGFMELVGYGWPGSELRKASKNLVAATEQVHTRTKNNELIVIGALLDLASGRMTGTPHPDWGKQIRETHKHQELRKCISEHLMVSGKVPEPFGETTLLNIFKKACNEFGGRFSS